MKALNYIMAAAFGLIGITAAVVAIINKRFELGCLAIICLILAAVAWRDTKDYD